MPLEVSRRADRSVLDEEWIVGFLLAARFGYLATVRESRPFVVPNIFVFDLERTSIYLHSARRGTTRSNIESNERVAFAVGEIGRVVPAGAAIDFGVEYASVVVHGLGSIVDDQSEAAEAMHLMMAKYSPDLEPGLNYRPVSAEDLAKTSVYRLFIDSWSGKRSADESLPSFR